MEKAPQKGQTHDKAPILSEREKRIETWAFAVAQELENRIANQTFTIFNGRNPQETMGVTVVEDMKQKGQALWEDPSLKVVYAREPGKDQGVILFFAKLIRTPEAGAIISKIMQEKKIPTDIWEEIKAKIRKNNPTSEEISQTKTKAGLKK